MCWVRQAVMHVFTPSNILVAFCKTGIQPFDSLKMLAPSIQMLFQLPQVFPIVQPSPVLETIRDHKLHHQPLLPLELHTLWIHPHHSHHFPTTFHKQHVSSASFAVEQNLVAMPLLSFHTLALVLLCILPYYTIQCNFRMQPPSLPSAPDLF